MGATGDPVFRIPAGDFGGLESLDGKVIGEADADRGVCLREVSEIRVNDDLEDGSGVGFGSVDDRGSRRVPPAALEHGPGAIEDRVAAIGDAECKH